MFTGLISHTGTIRDIQKSAQGINLSIESPREFFSDIKTGDSISVSGACLTVVSMRVNYFLVDVSSETLSKTTISKWRPGQVVNLEKSLRPSDRIGGHFVMGHIDGVGKLKLSKLSGESRILTFESDPGIIEMIVPKGSVAIDGISLTPVDRKDTEFSTAVIPHTLHLTTLGNLKSGDEVNIEIDIFARYIFNFLKNIDSGSSEKKSGLTLEKLRDEGY